MEGSGVCAMDDLDRIKHRYLLHRRIECAASTVARQGQHVDAWENFLAARQKSVADATNEDALDLVISFDQWHWSPSTVRQAISALRTMHEWLIDQGLAARNPWRVTLGA